MWCWLYWARGYGASAGVGVIGEPMDWATIAKEILLVLLGGGAGGAIVNALAQRSKVAADAHVGHAQAEDAEASAEQKRASVYQELVDNLRDDVLTLRGLVAQLTTQQNANMVHISELQAKDAKWQRQCDEMQAQMSHAQTQLAALQAERQEWKDGIDMLIAQLIELEIKPKWTRKGTRPL